MNLDTSIVIPQYNKIELTLACVKSIRKKEVFHWPIIVVDDGSEKQTSWIEKQFRQYDVELIVQDHKGVSAAWNYGISCTKTPYVVVLNNDVLFQGEVIEGLIAPLKNECVLMTGVRSRREQRLQSELLEKFPSVEFLEGWCLGLSRDLWQRTGGFDESMLVYWSDTDFQLRVMIENKGVRDIISVCDGLPVIHYGHQTTRGLKDYQSQWREDRDVFLKRWNGKRDF